jgi:hypothetical protein
MFKPCLVALVSMSTACIISDGDDGGDDGGGPPVQPSSGRWGYSEYTPVTSSSCPELAQYLDEGGTFLLDNHGNGTFTVRIAGEQPFDCSLGGGAFDCPDRVTVTSDTGVDATLTAHVRAGGRFTTSSLGSGRQHADLTCAGSQCSVVEATIGVRFPCAFDVDFVVGYLGP